MFSLARLNLSTKGGLRMRPLSDTVDSFAMPFGGPAAQLAWPSIRSTAAPVERGHEVGHFAEGFTQTNKIIKCVTRVICSSCGISRQIDQMGLLRKSLHLPVVCLSKLVCNAWQDTGRSV